MRSKSIPPLMVIISLALIFSAGIWAAPAAVQAQDPGTPRATVIPPTPRSDGSPAATATPVPDPDTPTSDNGNDDSSEAAINANNCATVYGTALNWGVGELGRADLRLYNDGWQLRQVSSDDGRFNFGGLGTGFGVLQVEAPGLKPMVNNAVVRLNCAYETRANIGFYGGDERPTPPGQITVRPASLRVSPGSLEVLQLTVSNTLPDPMSQVVVTDLFPEGFRIESADTNRGNLEILDGRLLAANLGSLPSGDEATIRVVLRTSAELSLGTVVENRATLFYAESAADQAVVPFVVMSPEEPTAAAIAAAPVEVTPPASNDTVQTSNRDLEAPVPSELPLTGVHVSLPLIGVGMLIALLLGRGLRSVQRRRR